VGKIRGKDGKNMPMVDKMAGEIPFDPDVQ